MSDQSAISDALQKHDHDALDTALKSDTVMSEAQIVKALMCTECSVIVKKYVLVNNVTGPKILQYMFSDEGLKTICPE